MRSDGSIVDREELVEFCIRAPSELAGEELKNRELQVWVRRPLLQDYRAEVEARYAPPDPKKKRTENWDAIFHEAIRRVLRIQMPTTSEKWTRFVDKLWEWACEKHGTNNVPGPDMIRVRLDEIISP